MINAVSSERISAMFRKYLFGLFCIALFLLITTLMILPGRKPITAHAMPTGRGYDTGFLQLCNTNCGFEYGNLTSWSTMQGWVTVSSDSPRSGRWAVNGSWHNNDYVYKNFHALQLAVFLY